MYVQIVNQIKEQIHRGELKSGHELPSIRELASSLGINMHTVRHAYNILREQKLVVFRLGQQAKVARLRSHPASSEEIASVIEKRLQELLTEAFLLGLSSDDFQGLVDEQIRKQKEQSQ